MLIKFLIAAFSVAGKTMSNNPWLVENIQEFSFLNCPECVFKVKEEDIFQDHAVKHHSLSSVLFGANISTEFHIKTEPNEDLIEYSMIESKTNDEIIEHRMVETEFNENIIENQLIKVEPSEDITEHQIKTEPDEDFTEDHIIDILDNVVDMNETHEELNYSDVEEKASIYKQNKLKRRYNSNSEAELEEEQGHKTPKKSFARAEKKLEKNSGEIENMLKSKDPCDKSSKKAKTPKIKHFKCSYCGEDYTQKEDLIKHMKSVHNTERFHQNLKCLYCEYSGWCKKIITEHIELCHSMEFIQNNKDTVESRFKKA